MKKLVTNDVYLTCKHCSLDYHVTCINVNEIDNSNDWLCRLCFIKICNDELPLGDPFVDLHCKLRKGLRIAHVNIRSLINKVDHLNVFLKNNDIHVLGISESWLSENIDDSEIHIDGYNSFRLDRQTTNDSHGGVLCYVKENLSCKHIIDFHDDDVETLFIEINLPHTKPILVGNVYRPPDASSMYLEKLDDIFQKCNNRYDEVYILGDFNVDISRKCNAKKISNVANNSSMHQLINDYTRITNTSRTIIDLVFVSKLDNVITSGSHVLGLSDHNLVFVVRKSKQIKVPPRTINSRCFKQFNDNDFVQTVKNINWSQIHDIEDVNHALETWQSLFIDACDRHAPFKEKRIKGHCLPQWINSDFLKLTKDRDYYFNKAHKTNSPEDWNMAKCLRNKCNNLRNKLKKNYCNDAIVNNVHDSKTLWKTIKKIIPSSSKSNVLPNVNSTDDVNFKCTADKFNKYFTSIGNELGKKFDNDVNVRCTCNSVCSDQCNSKFQFQDISSKFVLNQIYSMQNDKSTGLDQFNVKLLKLAAPYISNSLAFICNLSLRNGTFPDLWKKAKVTPIYKSGDKSDVGNYRPISVLPILSKIIERAIHDQLYSYLTNEGLLSDAQSGFRANHSTTTTLIDVEDYILKNMDEGFATGIIFIDLKKAFDTVNHSILLKKLENYGVTENEHKWFQSYLSNRSQTVGINSSLSDFDNVSIGIPQGSILGPLLFTIFVNCLPSNLDCKTVMYADDTSLMCKGKSDIDIQNKLELCLHHIANWFKANKLTLNVDKTKLMIVGTNHMLDKLNNINVKYDGNDIERVEEFKYLGVKFDSKLSWSAHVDYLCKNVSKRIGIIRRVKYFLPRQTVLLLSNALVMPHFDYGSTVWNNCTAEHHKRLQVLHNQLARTILSADIRTPTNDLMNSLNWVKLNNRWNNQLLVLLFKCLKNLSPCYLSSQFNFVYMNHNYSTRHSVWNSLTVPKCNSNSGQRTFHVRAANAWNGISPQIRSQLGNLSVRQFKNQLMNT